MFFLSSRNWHTICALVSGVQTCALPIYFPCWNTVSARLGKLQKKFFGFGVTLAGAPSIHGIAPCCRLTPRPDGNTGLLYFSRTSLDAVTGPAPGGANRLPARLPRAVRTATSAHVHNRPA